MDTPASYDQANLRTHFFADYDGTETGRRELLVPPAEQTTVQVTTLVKTSAPAVVGDVYGCGTEVPSYLVGG